MREAQHAQRCEVCREHATPLGARLRSLTVRPMTSLERDRAWAAIASGTRKRNSWLAEAVGQVRGLSRRRPMIRWVAAAAAVVLVLAPLHLALERDAVTQAQLNASTVVEQLEAPHATSVFVFETPKEHLSIIWVIEPGTTEGHR